MKKRSSSLSSPPRHDEPLRFLADESCDFSVVRALRAAGHDVVAVGEVAPRLEDTEVIERAVREERVLLTEDKDFGQLVYAGGHESSGVILIRFPSRARLTLAALVLETVQRHGERLAGSFVVLEPHRTRVRPG
jgi:predicted nuclease of predicted toxin-antitoxin system